jgi:hypothetical protein
VPLYSAPACFKSHVTVLTLAALLLAGAALSGVVVQALSIESSKVDDAIESVLYM